MGRTLQRLVGVALLAVLSGTPAVAAICAALCLPVHHTLQTDGNQGCHGRSGAGPTVTSREDIDCADHGLAGIATVASLIASRTVDDTTPPGVEQADRMHALASASSVDGRPLPAALASTLRPASSRLVLRI